MIRVLSVLDDTDRSAANLRAVGAHPLLAARGLEMRTVALAPGRLGGLDPVLPIMGPSSRSLASALQLRREHRWADVALAHGPHAVRALRLAALWRAAPTIDARSLLAPSSSDAEVAEAWALAIEHCLSQPV